MDYHEEREFNYFLHKLKSKEIDDKECLRMVYEFCGYMTEVVESVGIGCALADADFNDRVNMIMSRVDRERLIGHFAVMDILFEKVLGKKPELQKNARKYLSKGVNRRQAFRAYRESYGKK